MSLARDVTTVGGATLLSRVLGFLRDMQIPNLFRRLLAEGALNSAFVPMWLRILAQRGVNGARLFAETVLGTMMLGLGAIAVICIGFAPELMRLLAPGFAPDSERFLLAV